MSTTPILVIGATGSAGRRVAAHLRKLGAPVRAASRRGAVPFDWHDRGTWEPVLRGAGRMFLMAPDGIPVDPDFVALAADLGVGHVVLLSSRAIEAMGDQRLLDAEDIVKKSGTAWTILRVDWFDQNFDEGPFRASVLAGELAVPVGDCRQGFVDLDDVGEVAARVLTETGHAGRSYELTGPQALSFHEACAVIEEVSGRPVRFHGGEDAYRAAQAALGRPAEAIERDVAAFAALRALGDTEPLDTVPRLIGRPARSLREYAAAAAAGGCWRRTPGAAATP
ncbi:NAD(P)H azoreductase [Streptomyces sp. RB17]|uniref:NmrA family transcriptional regulator n=1 Tax=Streptomyces sp. RB17 TaxID=2585197 RepID=UPI0012980173|nr:NmrA family transcriptional regulator [Streptomyces sp. RB17]MQY33700.1 NAD(P)H azoreductase [Streptomyces sp. RB17]